MRYKRRWVATVLTLVLCITSLFVPGADGKKVHAAEDTGFVIENGVLQKYNGPGGNVVIPNGVTTIGSMCFFSNGNITSVTIPNGVTVIDSMAFMACSNLETVVIPDGVERIGSSAFSGCGKVTDLKIPDSVVELGDSAFSNCGMKNFVFPKNITVIEKNMFSNCHSLEKVVIPEGVTKIGETAFWNCENIKSLEIPASVTDLTAQEIFGGCAGIETIVVDEKNPVYDSRGKCNAIIETVTDKLIYGSKNTEIPSSVKILGTGSLYNYGSKKITIPKGVTTIERSAFGQNAVLEEIVIPDSVISMRFPICRDETTLIVLENSAAENMAKSGRAKYRCYSRYQVMGNTGFEKEEVEKMLEKNVTNDVVIQSNNDIEITFPQGSMSAVEGMETYDFSNTVTTESEEIEIPETVAKEDFIAKVEYNYSGQLPGTASIRIDVGVQYAGRKMLYALINDDNTLSEMQSVIVDVNGKITVSQSHCSAYMITLDTASFLGDVNADTKITAEDALAILKHIAGLATLRGGRLEAANVNGDTTVAADDALIVLKKIAGLIEKFDQ